MSLGDHAPSATWEPLPLSPQIAAHAWVWFFPPTVPQAVVINLPDELFAALPPGSTVTLRALVQALGADPRGVVSWSRYGAFFDAQQGQNPAWDVPLSRNAPGTDGTICLFPAAQLGMTPPPLAASPAASGGDIHRRMEADWQTCQQLELQLDAAAKQLNSVLMRLGSLNRDLTSEEARLADNLEKRDWQDARRWLREVAGRVSRFLKEHHVGMTSAAGKRNYFEELHRQYVVPRRNFDGLVQAERDLEVYRKTLQTLLNNMHAAHGSAVQDGERRAQQVLSRISARVRTARTKRG